MKQLFKVASADILQSLMPILTWYAIGIAYRDTDYFNVFTLTYYYQFIWSIIYVIIVKGTIKYTKKSMATDISSIYCAILLSAFIFSLVGIGIWLNLNTVMTYMNIQYKYKYMFMLSILYLNLEIIICGICKVEQYYNREANAFKISMCYYTFKILLVSVLGIIIKDEVKAIITTAIIMIAYVTILCIKKFDIKTITFNVFKGAKYEVSSLVGEFGLLIIYFFGIQQVAGQSEIFLASYNICAMCTDTQWDILSSAIDTTTSLEICNGTYEKNKKKIAKNAIAWGIILFISSLLMILISYLFTNFSLKIAITILLLECVWFPLYSIRYSFESWLKLEYSGIWLVVIYISAYVVRTIVTFSIKSEYNLSIGVLITAIIASSAVCMLYAIKHKEYKLKQEIV
jgi:hypothetical protein